MHLWPAVLGHSPPLAPCVDAAFRVPDSVSTTTATVLKQRGTVTESDICSSSSARASAYLKYTQVFHVWGDRQELSGGVHKAARTKVPESFLSASLLVTLHTKTANTNSL